MTTRNVPSAYGYAASDWIPFDLEMNWTGNPWPMGRTGIIGMSM